METLETTTEIATTTENDVILSPENVNLEIESVDIGLDGQIFTFQQPALYAVTPQATLKYTDGDILISLLLSILIILNIFSGIHNIFFGVKIKKQLYD